MRAIPRAPAKRGRSDKIRAAFLGDLIAFCPHGKSSGCCRVGPEGWKRGLHPEDMTPMGWWRARSEDEVEHGHVEKTKCIRMDMACPANWNPCKIVEKTKSILLMGMFEMRIRCVMKAM
jgi:hypothetical protein